MTESAARGEAVVTERVPWRLIESGPGAPAWNMAVDEALLLEAGDDDPPILRLYGWDPPAISLGRFQPAAEPEPPPGVELVRRLTGGAAIHHRRDELTYAIVAPYRLFPGRGPRAAYCAIHEVLAQALTALGVAPQASAERPAARASRHGMCYANPTDYDLVAGTRKLVGSAQRRAGRRFLQHGSIPLSPEPDVPEAVSLSELLGATPTPARVAEAVREAFRETLTARLIPDALREAERARAKALHTERYSSSAWTFAR